MVRVMLLGQTLRQSVEEPEFQFELAAPTSVKGLLEAYRDRLAAVFQFLDKGELLVTVNRKVATLDSPVRDGDTIKLTHQFNPRYDGATWHNP